MVCFELFNVFLGMCIDFLFFFILFSFSFGIRFFVYALCKKFGYLDFKSYLADL